MAQVVEDEFEVLARRAVSPSKRAPEPKPIACPDMKHTEPPPPAHPATLPELTDLISHATHPPPDTPIHLTLSDGTTRIVTYSVAQRLNNVSKQISNSRIDADIVARLDSDLLSQPVKPPQRYTALIARPAEPTKRILDFLMTGEHAYLRLDSTDMRVQTQAELRFHDISHPSNEVQRTLHAFALGSAVDILYIQQYFIALLGVDGMLRKGKQFPAMLNWFGLTPHASEVTFLFAKDKTHYSELYPEPAGPGACLFDQLRRQTLADFTKELRGEPVIPAYAVPQRQHSVSGTRKAETGAVGSMLSAFMSRGASKRTTTNAATATPEPDHTATKKYAALDKRTEEDDDPFDDTDKRILELATVSTKRADKAVRRMKAAIGEEDVVLEVHTAVGNGKVEAPKSNKSTRKDPPSTVERTESKTAKDEEELYEFFRRWGQLWATRSQDMFELLCTHGSVLTKEFAYCGLVCDIQYVRVARTNEVLGTHYQCNLPMVSAYMPFSRSALSLLGPADAEMYFVTIRY